MRTIVMCIAVCLTALQPLRQAPKISFIEDSVDDSVIEVVVEIDPKGLATVVTPCWKINGEPCALSVENQVSDSITTIHFIKTVPSKAKVSLEIDATNAHGTTRAGPFKFRMQ